MPNWDTIKKMRDAGQLDDMLDGKLQCRAVGESEWYAGMEFVFIQPYENCEFRPVPKPPQKVLRPWTAEELWEHRDCWFRRKDAHHQKSKPLDIELHGIAFLKCSRTVIELRDRYECCSYNGIWLPCGIEVDAASRSRRKDVSDERRTTSGV